MGSFKIDFDTTIEEDTNLVALLMRNHLVEVVPSAQLFSRNFPKMGEIRALSPHYANCIKSQFQINIFVR